MALLKYCNKNGCSNLILQGKSYCDTHMIIKAEENKERHKEYDTHCRNQKAKKFYNSNEWKVARARALARDINIDIYLYIVQGAVEPADTVHHIIELSEDYSMRIDLDNLISLSEATHSMVSKAYKKDEASRVQMQNTLRECMEQYKQRFG